MMPLLKTLSTFCLSHVLTLSDKSRKHGLTILHILILLPMFSATSVQFDKFEPHIFDDAPKVWFTFVKKMLNKALEKIISSMPRTPLGKSHLSLFTEACRFDYLSRKTFTRTDLTMAIFKKEETKNDFEIGKVNGTFCRSDSILHLRRCTNLSETTEVSATVEINPGIVENSCYFYVWKFSLDTKLRLLLYFWHIFFFANADFCLYGHVKVVSTSSKHQKQLFCGQHSNTFFYPENSKLFIVLVPGTRVYYNTKFNFSVQDRTLFYSVLSERSLLQLASSFYLPIHKTLLLSLLVHTQKYKTIELDLDQRKDWNLTVYNGPGVRSKELKAERDTVIISGFQCFIQLYNPADRDLSVVLPAKRYSVTYKCTQNKNIQQLIVRNNTKTLKFPQKNSTSQITHITLLGNFNLNLTIHLFEYDGMWHRGCSYGGIGIYDVAQELPVSSFDYCPRKKKTFPRPLYSAYKSVIVVIYCYLEYAAVVADVQIATTHCQPFTIDACSFKLNHGTIGSHLNWSFFSQMLPWKMERDGRFSFFNLMNTSCTIVQVRSRGSQEQYCAVHLYPTPILGRVAELLYHIKGHFIFHKSLFGDILELWGVPDVFSPILVQENRVRYTYQAFLEYNEMNKFSNDTYRKRSHSFFQIGCEDVNSCEDTSNTLLGKVKVKEDLIFHMFVKSKTPTYSDTPRLDVYIQPWSTSWVEVRIERRALPNISSTSAEAFPCNELGYVHEIVKSSQHSLDRLSETQSQAMLLNLNAREKLGLAYPVTATMAACFFHSRSKYDYCSSRYRFPAWAHTSSFVLWEAAFNFSSEDTFHVVALPAVFDNVNMFFDDNCSTCNILGVQWVEPFGNTSRVVDSSIKYCHTNLSSMKHNFCLCFPKFSEHTALVYLEVGHLDVDPANESVVYLKFKSWREAATRCKHLDSDLPTFAGQKELVKLLAFLKLNTQFPPLKAIFVGLSRKTDKVCEDHCWISGSSGICVPQVNIS